MNYGNIKKFDIADGEGVRVSLFVSGCTNKCPGCFQPETWDFHYGQPYTKDTETEILEALGKEYIQGLTMLGGEPFEIENQKVLITLVRKVKEMYPEKDIWCYTGFVLDKDLIAGGRRHCEVTDEFLSYIDILVDGPFIQDRKNLSLKFRGSENQRVIDMKKSKKFKEVIRYLE